MIRTFTSLFIMTQLILFLTFIGIADGQALTVKKKTLYCGDARLTAESTLLNIASHVESLCTKQTITLMNPHKNISIKMPLEGKLERVPSIYQAPFLDAVVAEWACLKSTTTGTSYIFFFYNCSSDTTDCKGAFKEWIRIFTVDGVNLTDGFSRYGDGGKLENLCRKLGISERDVQNYTHKFKGVIYEGEP